MENQDFTQLLPPELWTQIFGYLTQKHVVPLREISLYFKNMIDEHITFCVDMNGLASTSIPGPHVKIQDAKMKNFFIHPPLVNPIFHLGKLKRIVFGGPTHQLLIQNILTNAINLNQIKLCCSTFKIGGGQDMMPSIGHLSKLLALTITKKEGIVATYNENVLMREGFAQSLPKMLNIPNSLPHLRVLKIVYNTLPADTIITLCHSTIIPFIKLHYATLMYLKLDLSSFRLESREQFGPQFPYPPIQSTNNSNVVHLSILELYVPDAIVRDILISLWGQDSAIPCGTLQELSLFWRSPYTRNGNQEKENLANSILQKLLLKNRDSLQSIEFEDIILYRYKIFNFMDGSNQVFSTLKFLSLDGRVRDIASRNLDILYQNKLLEQQFPMLISLHLTCLRVDFASLRAFIMGCPLLQDVQLESLCFIGGDGIDEPFVQDLMTKPGMIVIRIGMYDLLYGWNDGYWFNFKFRNVNHWNLDNQDFVVIRP